MKSLAVNGIIGEMQGKGEQNIALSQVSGFRG